MKSGATRVLRASKAFAVTFGQWAVKDWAGKDFKGIATISELLEILGEGFGMLIRFVFGAAVIVLLVIVGLAVVVWAFRTLGL